MTERFEKARVLAEAFKHFDEVEAELALARKDVQDAFGSYASKSCANLADARKQLVAVGLLEE